MPPAIDRAVQTTPPMTMAATIPLEPLRPIATKMTLATIRVIKVIPETGLLPTMAIALAATVVNRKAITRTTIKATTVCIRLWITPI